MLTEKAGYFDNGLPQNDFSAARGYGRLFCGRLCVWKGRKHGKFTGTKTGSIESGR